jgi:Uma2 family endonuclease
MAMESIRECIVVKADEMRIEQFSKQNPKQWIYKIYNERDDIISIDSVNCKVSLAEIYSQINFREAQMSARAGA